LQQSLFINEKIRFDYFKVVCLPKFAPDDDEDQAYNLDYIINKWSNLTLQERIRPCRKELARLEELDYKSEKKIYTLLFCRLRDNKIPSKVKQNEPSRPIELEKDEFLGEKVSAVYDEDLNILILQKSTDSLSASGIQEYINIFVDPSLKVYLRPIFIPDILEKVNNAKIIKSIDIKFAGLNKNSTLKVGSSLGKCISSVQEYERVNSSLFISVGKKKNRSLVLERVRNLINDILVSKDIVKSASVSIQENENSSIDYIDLIEQRVFDYLDFCYVRREELSHNEIVGRVIDHYYINQRDKIQHYVFL
jgi:hypothetical protein